jgi:hypothetical protein
MDPVTVMDLYNYTIDKELYDEIVYTRSGTYPDNPHRGSPAVEYPFLLEKEYVVSYMTVIEFVRVMYGDRAVFRDPFTVMVRCGTTSVELSGFSIHPICTVKTYYPDKARMRTVAVDHRYVVEELANAVSLVSTKTVAPDEVPTFAS